MHVAGEPAGMPSVIDHPALPAIKKRFSEVQFRVAEFRDQVTLIVPREVLVEVCAFLKTDEACRFEQLTDLHAVDYKGFPGAAARFAVHYLLTSISLNQRLTLKVLLNPSADHPSPAGMRDEDAVNDGDPALMVPSVYGVWHGADWMEREAYDLMGILFTRHPDLRRIMTWNGFGSHPLRKDYPLRGIGEREDYKVVTREGA